MSNPIQKSNREHSFDSELASLVGIEKAILLKNISYWVDENERKKLESSFAYGKWWTFESLTSLAKKYPYMKRGNLSRWFKELRQDKWILMFSTTDGANMYTPGPVFNSWNLGQDWPGVFQNETGRQWGEVFQNEPKAEFQNETEAAAQNETHNNVESNIEKNVELEGEREAEKNTPTPETYDQFMERVNAETRDVEEKEKEKAPQVAAAPPTIFSGFREVYDYLEENNPGIFDEPYTPTHTITTVEKTAVPGTITKIVEGINLEPTNANQITIKTGMNEAGETYIFEHTERVTIPAGPKYPLATNAMEAQKIIENWCAVHGEQIRWSYDAARRKLTAEDLHERLIDFCGHYANTEEKQRLFFNDPARMFQNGLTKWLQTQNKFDREQREKAAQPKNGFPQPETKSNLPKSIRRY